MGCCCCCHFSHIKCCQQLPICAHTNNKYQRRWSFSRHCYIINLFNLLHTHTSSHLILFPSIICREKMMRKIQIKIGYRGFMMLFCAQITQYPRCVFSPHFLSFCDKTYLQFIKIIIFLSRMLLIPSTRRSESIAFEWMMHTHTQKKHKYPNELFTDC